MVAVASTKGGVGKTTVATNLAVTLRALREDLEILLVPLDDQPLPDRMFRLGPWSAPPTVADALRRGTFAGAIRVGQYGVHHVPVCPDVEVLRREVRSVEQITVALRRSGWRGLVLLDTKSDLDLPTKSALEASDLAVVVVKEEASLHEASRVFGLLDGWGRPRSRTRVLLSSIDLRVKYTGEGERDILALLLSALRQRGYPHFATFLSQSPALPALTTNPLGRALPILHGPRGTRIQRQMRGLAEEVLEALTSLAAVGVARRAVPSEPRKLAARIAAAEAPSVLRRWILRGERAEHPS